MGFKMAIRNFLAFALVLAGLCIYAEQKVQLGAYEVHYSVINSTFLQPEIAERYKIVRAEKRAVITISVLHDKSVPAPTNVSGSFTNLLSQRMVLDFKLIEEGTARYYLASFLFTSEEPLTFDIEVQIEEERQSFQFKQKVYTP